jgi:hypothetical protein
MEYASIRMPFARWYIILDIPHMLINIETTMVQLLCLKRNIKEAIDIAIDALNTNIYGVKTFPPGRTRLS